MARVNRMTDAEGASGRELYRILAQGLPRHRKQREQYELDCFRLAEDLQISYQAVHQWLQQDRLPARRVKRLCALPGSMLKVEDLLPFLLK